MIEEQTRKVWRLLRALDWWLVGAMLALCVVSVAFVFSATYRGPDVPQPPFYLQQALWVCLGLVVFIAATLVDYRAVARVSPLLYAAGLVLLVFVLVAPDSIVPRVNGAKSWINLHWFRLQPSEFARLACVVFLAHFFAQRVRVATAASTLWGAIAIVATVAGLIVLQPDMGMAAVLVPVFFAVAFVAGVRAKALLWVLVAALLVSPLVWTYGLKEYQRRRLVAFLNPERDLATMMGVGWCLRQSKIAVGSGSLLGEGYLQGGQKLLGFLPRGVVHNDYIFAVVAEETGFVGSLVVVGLYGLLLLRALRVGLRLREPLAQGLAAGIVTMLFFSVFVNIGMTIGLMPITGLPLPLVSYGGSAMLSTMLALGLLQSAYVRRQLY